MFDDFKTVADYIYTTHYTFAALKIFVATFDSNTIVKFSEDQSCSGPDHR